MFSLYVLHSLHRNEVAPYLESDSTLNAGLQLGRNRLVELLHYAHSKLRLNPATADQFVEGVCKCLADAGISCQWCRPRKRTLGQAAYEVLRYSS